MGSRGMHSRIILIHLGIFALIGGYLVNAEVFTTTTSPDEEFSKPIITFEPSEILIMDNQDVVVNYNVTIPLSLKSTEEYRYGLSNPMNFVNIESQNQITAGVKDKHILPFSTSLKSAASSSTIQTSSGNFTVAGRFLGITTVNINIGSPNSTVYVQQSYTVKVMRSPHPIDKIFNIVLTICIILANFMFGCLFDIPVAKEVLRKPIAPIIGFLCQYTIMPTTSYLVGWVLDMPTSLRLGLLAVGCSPGGGSSNIWSLNLNGDVTLSIVMTFISNVCALFMMPTWLLTLGKQIGGDHIHIPFLNILMSLLMFIVPIFIGLAVCKWKPKVRAVVHVIARPYTLIQALFMITVGLWSNWYVFTIVEQDLRILVAGMCLPYMGLTLGCIVALIFRQSRPRIITIGIETAFQNGALALILLRRTLAIPEGDIASVAAVISAILTPLPLLVAFICLIIKTRCIDRVRKKGLYDPVAQDEKEAEANGNDVALKEPIVA